MKPQGKANWAKDMDRYDDEQAIARGEPLPGSPPDVSEGAGLPASLDVAWAKAEAALPDGWWIQLDHGGEATVRAMAGAGAWSPGYDSIIVQEPTPAAALLALVDRLASSETRR